MERIQKILSNAGYCSRREAEDIIAQGAVSVNGKIATIGDSADPDKDKIRVYGERLKYDERRYIALHKPRNVLTTLDDPSDKATLQPYLTQIRERVVPCGRLDYDAHGLLILTNDGDFANKIMHPSYELEKTYLAKVDKTITDTRKLLGVTLLKDGPVHVHSARIVDGKIELTIHEGRNHIVKRFLRKHGYYVEDLQRISVGPVDLGQLAPGRTRPLTKKEIQAIQSVSRKRKKR